MSNIKSSLDLKSFIISSHEHLNHIIDGQVMDKVRERLEDDIKNDEKIIVSFFDNGGRILSPDEERDYTEISFASSYWRQYLDGKVVMCLSALDHTEAERIDEAICAMLDMHGAEAALEGSIETICRNAANYDYLTGMDSFSKEVRKRELGTVVSCITGDEKK